MPRSFCGSEKPLPYRGILVIHISSEKRLVHPSASQSRHNQSWAVRNGHPFTTKYVFTIFGPDGLYSCLNCNLKLSLKYLDLYYFLQRATNSVQKH